MNERIKLIQMMVEDLQMYVQQNREKVRKAEREILVLKEHLKESVSKLEILEKVLKDESKESDIEISDT